MSELNASGATSDQNDANAADLGAMADVPTPGEAARTAADYANADRSKTGKLRVKWYRCKVPRETMSQLNQRSDLLGLAQTLGFLAVLCGGAALAIYSWARWPWYVTALLVFVNGHLWHFTINGFHELIHDSVFKTRWLNRFFLRVFSFLGWHNHHWFWASHTEHHKYTLHPPDDLEVIVPQNHSIKSLLTTGIIDWRYPIDTLRGTLRTASGRIDADSAWSQYLFPESEPERRRQYFNWARLVLIGHGLIVGISLAMGWWIVPLVITFPCIFGRWLHTLCNESQHAGLPDNVADFRLCCRTMYLNPVLQFLYWHMNYHAEHHMFAAVPCYRLRALHRAIRHEMPPCPRGLIATWKQIYRAERREREEPGWHYIPELPTEA